MGKIKKVIRDFLHSFSKEAEMERRRKEMHEFLAQAVDRRHLEYLERQWANRHGWM